MNSTSSKVFSGQIDAEVSPVQIKTETANVFESPPSDFQTSLEFNDLDDIAGTSENENTLLAVINSEDDGRNETATLFVTEDEIKASLAKKEENVDSISLTGSCAGDSISQLSTLTKNSSFDDVNLSAIMNRKNELINSIKNRLDTSHVSITSDDLNDEPPFDISTFTVIAEKTIRDDKGTSPFQEIVPPAAKFKPSFSISETSQALNHISNSVHNQTQYEEAFASLSEILTNTATDSILDFYSSKLEAYREEDNRKFDEILSQIDNDKRNFLHLVEDDPIGELEDQINMISGGIKQNSEASGNTVPSSTGDDKLVPSQPSVEESGPCQEEVKEISPIITTAAVEDNNDPENLILGEEESSGEVFDEDSLLKSDDESGVEEAPSGTPKEPAKCWEDFVSNDEEENRDNNDPKWEYLRNLGSDYERYKAVQARWRNLEVPNPKRDLTCRCRNVSRSRTYTGGWPRINEYGKRLLCSPDGDRRYAKRPRRESCTVLYDLSIQQLIQDVENERHAIEIEQKQRLTALVDQQITDQIMAQQERKNEIFIRQMKQRHYAETEVLMKDFRRRRDVLTESARQKMDALRKAGDEVRQFHEFYPNENGVNGTHDNNAVIYFTETEVQEILEVENMLMQFESFYSEPAV